MIPQESEILPIYTEYSSKWKKYLITHVPFKYFYYEQVRPGKRASHTVIRFTLRSKYDILAM